MLGVADWIERVYNRRRRHSALNMLTPVRFEHAVPDECARQNVQTPTRAKQAQREVPVVESGCHGLVVATAREPARPAKRHAERAVISCEERGDIAAQGTEHPVSDAEGAQPTRGGDDLGIDEPRPHSDCPVRLPRVVTVEHRNDVSIEQPDTRVASATHPAVRLLRDLDTRNVAYLIADSCQAATV